MNRGWKLMDVQYLHHKAVTSIALEREDGKRIYVNVSDEAFEKHHTAYFPSSQAKESPHTDVESVVGAGIDFLMKVTEEAVISGMILAGDSPSRVRDPNIRKHYRDAAEDITLEEVRRSVAGDGDSPFTFRPHTDDPAYDSDDTETQAAHGVPAPLDWTATPPRILPADRYAPGAVFLEEDEELRPMGSDAEFVRYLDATQGK